MPITPETGSYLRADPQLETETRNGRQGRLADHLTRMDFIVLDELC